MENIEKENGSFAKEISLPNLTENHKNYQNAELKALYPPSFKKHFKRRLALVRVYDFLLSFFILFVLAIPVVLIVLYKIAKDGFPLFYNSKRIGKKGISFTVFKFRTMIDDQKFIKEYLKDQISNGFEKLSLDCTLYTKTGRLFERYQIVEILQLFNVIRGEMSIIGYRPLPATHVQYLTDELGEEKMLLRHSVLPGITGLSQIYGKLNLSNNQRVDVENTYNAFLLTQSQVKTIYLNTLIIFETALQVFFKKNTLMPLIKKILQNSVAADSSIPVVTLLQPQLS